MARNIPVAAVSYNNTTKLIIDEFPLTCLLAIRHCQPELMCIAKPFHKLVVSE